MKTSVFIDGQAGTTGLRIRERIEKREDVTLVTLSEDKRKDDSARRDAIRSSDIAFLCLPDDAARQAVSFAEGSLVRLIDASTAHRTAPGWAYGFPELSPDFREKIRTSKRVAVPGCYASGFASLVYPMVQSGLMPRDYPVTCFALSGYSGGGKKMIAEMESPDRPEEWSSPRLYGLSNNHKHLPEMQFVSGLSLRPQFTPIVDAFYAGMLVCVPVSATVLGHALSPETVHAMFADWYRGAAMVTVSPLDDGETMAKRKLSANDLRGTDSLEVFVFGDEQQLLLCARLDNLGKGASGAAVQCMNIMLGLDETTGLIRKGESV